ncbi:STAS domain-containing protein [Nonomuraea sp. NPDC050680]|uniref:STAS domain-containing protein n=1 Tax=Nonomuraea sp. NPDC050680 TaxID=3154630 RepID=UPI00340E2D05
MPPLSLYSQRLIIGVLITVTGEVDTINAAQLETYVRGQLRPGEPLLLDLDGLTFLDSMGLHLLLRLNATLSEQGAALHLAAVRGAPARILEITGLSSALNIHTTAGQAITRILSELPQPQEPA